MRKSFLGLIGLLVGLSAQTALAAPRLELGLPATGGSGCPAGTVDAVLSPDNTELSILFDDYIVETTNRRRIARKSCNIAIPVKVPQGYSISIIETDYRGYVSLPNRRSSARFTADYFFAGSRGVRFSKRWRGFVDEDYTFAADIGVEALVWSACGAQTNLRVNTNMLVRARGEALATVDSADFSSGIIYHFKWKRCR